jgi:putative transcriptional regulator
MITNRIQELRTERRMTQEELAARLQVTRQTVISLEKNRYIPSLEMGFKVAELFHKRIEDIFDYTEEI